jgi:hypothetical protein
MTEAEYWADYSLIHNDVQSAIETFYTYVEIHNFAAENDIVYRRMNKHPTFWNIQLHALQATFFITLSRIFDSGKDVHSIHKLLAATVAHPEFFSKDALAIRKWDEGDEPEWLANYLSNAFEPTTSDLRALKKALSPIRSKYALAYHDIRNYVFAHKVLKEQQQITTLFGNTKIGDVDEILYSLHDLTEAIWQLFHNGIKPELGVCSYDYRNRIKNTVRGVMESLLLATPKVEA